MKTSHVNFVITECCGWGGTSRCLVKPSAQGAFSWSRLRGVVSASPRTERFHCLPGLLFQCLATVAVKAFFLRTTSGVPALQLASIAPCLSAVFWCLFV